MHETSQNKLVKLIPKLGIEYYYDGACDVLSKTALAEIDV